VFDPIVVQSQSGPYSVEFDDDAFGHLTEDKRQKLFIVDANVARIYSQELATIRASSPFLTIEASEANKSLERLPQYITQLLQCGIRRDYVLLAIGGGIIQDITCFIAAVLLRGIEWHFYPTTLLAQADSCIGSKSSINVGVFKNIVGTYTPPKRIVISTSVLKSLQGVDIRSGIGEMLKVHVIAGPTAFDSIAADCSKIGHDSAITRHYIRRSLNLKKSIIEQDEFDRGIRNKMNLGHSFGHAIESATGFTVPHGIAVTIGIDMANFLSVRLGRMNRNHFDRMHPTLRRNYQGFERTDIPKNLFFEAILRDKKNSETKLGLILPDANAIPQRVECANDDVFQSCCSEYFERERIT